MRPERTNGWHNCCMVADVAEANLVSNVVDIAWSGSKTTIPESNGWIRSSWREEAAGWSSSAEREGPAVTYGAWDRDWYGWPVVRGSTVNPGDRAGWVSGPFDLTVGVYVRLLLYELLWPAGGVCRNGGGGKDPCWSKSRLLKSVKDLIQSSSVAALWSNLHPDCNLLQEPKTNNSLQYPRYVEKMALRTSPIEIRVGSYWVLYSGSVESGGFSWVSAYVTDKSSSLSSKCSSSS